MQSRLRLFLDWGISLCGVLYFRGKSRQLCDLYQQAGFDGCDYGKSDSAILKKPLASVPHPEGMTSV